MNFIKDDASMSITSLLYKANCKQKSTGSRATTTTSGHAATGQRVGDRLEELEHDGIDASLIISATLCL